MSSHELGPTLNLGKSIPCPSPINHSWISCEGDGCEVIPIPRASILKQSTPLDFRERLRGLRMQVDILSSGKVDSSSIKKPNQSDVPNSEDKGIQFPTSCERRAKKVNSHLIKPDLRRLMIQSDDNLHQTDVLRQFDQDEEIEGLRRDNHKLAEKIILSTEKQSKDKENYSSNEGRVRSARVCWDDIAQSKDQDNNSHLYALIEEQKEVNKHLLKTLQDYENRRKVDAVIIKGLEDQIVHANKINEQDNIEPFDALIEEQRAVDKNMLKSTHDYENRSKVDAVTIKVLEDEIIYENKAPLVDPLEDQIIYENKSRVIDHFSMFMKRANEKIQPLFSQSEMKFEIGANENMNSYMDEWIDLLVSNIQRVMNEVAIRDATLKDREQIISDVHLIFDRESKKILSSDISDEPGGVVLSSKLKSLFDLIFRLNHDLNEEICARKQVFHDNEKLTSEINILLNRIADQQACQILIEKKLFNACDQIAQLQSMNEDLQRELNIQQLQNNSLKTQLDELVLQNKYNATIQMKTELDNRESDAYNTLTTVPTEYIEFIISFFDHLKRSRHIEFDDILDEAMLQAARDSSFNDSFIGNAFLYSSSKAAIQYAQWLERQHNQVVDKNNALQDEIAAAAAGFTALAVEVFNQRREASATSHDANPLERRCFLNEDALEQKIKTACDEEHEFTSRKAGLEIIRGDESGQCENGFEMLRDHKASPGEESAINKPRTLVDDETAFDTERIVNNFEGYGIEKLQESGNDIIMVQDFVEKVTANDGKITEETFVCERKRGRCGSNFVLADYEKDLLKMLEFELSDFVRQLQEKDNIISQMKFEAEDRSQQMMLLSQELDRIKFELDTRIRSNVNDRILHNQEPCEFMQDPDSVNNKSFESQNTRLSEYEKLEEKFTQISDEIERLQMSYPTRRKSPNVTRHKKRHLQTSLNDSLSIDIRDEAEI